MGYKIGKGKPPKQTQWKPGQSGNPEGARRHDPIVKQFKKPVSLVVADAIHRLILSKISQLEETIENPDSSALHIGIATVLKKSSKKGNFRVLDALLTRLIGPAPNAPIEAQPAIRVSQKELNRLKARLQWRDTLEAFEKALNEMRSSDEIELAIRDVFATRINCESK